MNRITPYEGGGMSLAEIESSGKAAIIILQQKSEIMDVAFKIAMKHLDASQFIAFGNETTTCNLGKSGATAVLSVLGISTKLIRTWKEPNEDEKGKFYIAYAEMIGIHPQLGEHTVQGFCSTREKLHGVLNEVIDGKNQKRFKNLSEINLTNVEQHAISQAKKQLVKLFIGRETFLISEIEKLFSGQTVKRQAFNSESQKNRSQETERNPGQPSKLETAMVERYGSLEAAKENLKRFPVFKKGNPEPIFFDDFSKLAKVGFWEKQIYEKWLEEIS